MGISGVRAPHTLGFSFKVVAWSLQFVYHIVDICDGGRSTDKDVGQTIRWYLCHIALRRVHIIGLLVTAPQHANPLRRRVCWIVLEVSVQCGSGAETQCAAEYVQHNRFVRVRLRRVYSWSTHSVLPSHTEKLLR